MLKLEITALGEIYRYSIDDILLGVHSFRNPKLIAVLHKFEFIENYGTGIKKIREAYPNYDIRKLLINHRLWFRVALPDLNYKKAPLRDNVPQNVLQNVPQTKMVKIILAIRKNNKITRSELAKIIDKSFKTVARIIKEFNCISFNGSSKAGYWEIIEEKKMNKL